MKKTFRTGRQHFVALFVFFILSPLDGATPECAFSKIAQGVSTASIPNRPFTGVQALRAEVNPAVNRAYEILQAEIASEKRSRSSQTLESRFLELLEKENGGLFHFFDCPEGFLLKDGTQLPKKYADLLVTDHHDGRFAQYFDSQNPKKNTTVQLLEIMEKELNLSGGDTKKAAEDLKRRLGKPSTHNLADGMEALYIVNHLEKFLEDPSLRDKMKVAQYFVDFGVFGGKAFEKDPKVELAKLFPGKTFSDADIREGIEIGKALLQNYNQIILDPQSEIKMGDRFHEVTFGAVREEVKQEAIAEKALKGIDLILNPKSSNERALLAKQFQEKRELATNAVKNEAGKLRTDMGNNLKSPEHKELLKDYDSNGGKLGSLMFAHYGINPNGQEGSYAATGLFAAWSGPGNAHSLPFDLTINPKIGPNKDRTGFILSNIDGREIPEINLKQFGSTIYGLHVIAVRKRLSATGLTGAELEAETAKQAGNPIGGREPLQYSFGGVEVPPEQILVEAYKFLKPFKP